MAEKNLINLLNSFLKAGKQITTLDLENHRVVIEDDFNQCEFDYCYYVDEKIEFIKIDQNQCFIKIDDVEYMFDIEDSCNPRYNRSTDEYELQDFEDDYILSSDELITMYFNESAKEKITMIINSHINEIDDKYFVEYDGDDEEY